MGKSVADFSYIKKKYWFLKCPFCVHKNLNVGDWVVKIKNEFVDGLYYLVRVNIMMVNSIIGLNM